MTASCLSPAVKYHALARRHLLLLGFLMAAAARRRYVSRTKTTRSPSALALAVSTERQYRRRLMDRHELALAIVRVARITGDFRLRSGATSTEYFDKYRFESDPRLLRAIARHLAPLVPPGTEALAGLELGGIPIAAALSLETGLPAAFVRKEAKPYGTCQLAEGIDVMGRRLLVVEDVITSGGQVLKSTEHSAPWVLSSHPCCA